jgi:UPF0755 protein
MSDRDNDLDLHVEHGYVDDEYVDYGDDVEHELLEDEAVEPERSFRRRRRRVVLAVALLLGVPLAVLGAGLLWFWWQLDPPGDPGEPVAVRVEKGWGVSEIGDELADEGVVSSSFVFSAYARLTDAGPFQSGEYELRRDLGVRDAIRVLEDGPAIEYTNLAAPPGWWLEQIAVRVGEFPGLDAERFLDFAHSGAVRSKFQPEGVDSLEGLVWPDTYRVSESEDELQVLEQMVAEFDRHASRAGLGTDSVNGVTPYEAVVIASLIQGEARVDVDRPLIASVIYNRLRAGMPLQIDATVLYASGDPQKRTITAADLERPSPYNTYRTTGLPPTPIASVTEESLEAALHPAQTDYLYYVIADADGRHAFSATYDEFLRDKQAAKDKGLL